MSIDAPGERVLLPIRILTGETLDEDLVTVLSTLPVVILGYHVVPEQTPPSQMRQQYESKAEKTLSTFAQEFEDVDGTVETRLIFTHNADQSIERVADDVSATAIVHINPVGPVTSLLVALDAVADPARLAPFTAALCGGRDIAVTLIAPDSEDGNERIAMTRSALMEQSVPAASITTHSVQKRSFVTNIIDTAVDHDVTIMGAHQPDWRSLLFGDVEERVATESLGPVIEVLADDD